MSGLFEREVRVVTVGLASFADAIRQSGAHATQVQWSPPAHGDREVAVALASLVRHRAVGAGNAVEFQESPEARARSAFSFAAHPSKRIARTMGP